MTNLPPPNDTQSLGKYMAILAWILVLLLFGLFFNYWYKKNTQPVPPQVITAEGIEKTIIKRNPANQYLTKGSINQHPVGFLLDTGSTDIVIPGELAEKLKLKRGIENVADTAGGRIVVFDTTIKELTIGHIKLRNLNASVSPGLKSEDVILGMSARKKIDFYQQGDNLILTVTRPNYSKDQN